MNLYKYRIILIAVFLYSCKQEDQTPVICYFQEGKLNEKLVAKELRKYIYQRTSVFPQVKEIPKFPEDNIKAIIVATVQELKILGKNSLVMDSLNTLNQDGFYIKSLQLSQLLIAGKEAMGALYEAYNYIENSLGVGFYLHRDTLPDEKLKQILLSGSYKTYNSLFKTRGILPFHDFSEGPD